MGEFGQKFRKARETRGISLDDVSKVTKISSRMLQAIEDEHFDQLPGGIFNKGFIRAYARHLGMDDEEAVAGYLASLRQAQIDASNTLQSSLAAQTRTAPSPPPAAPVDDELADLQLPRAEHVRPPRRDYAYRSENPVSWRLLAATALVLILAFLVWNRHSHRVAAKNASPLTPQSSLAPQAVPATSTLPTPPAAKIVASAHPITTAKLPPATNAPIPPESSQNDVTAKPTAKLAPAAPATNPPLTLVIRAVENSWISVTADGQSVSEETLIAPARTSIHASREIVVKTGNAAGVTFVWNGEEISAQGAESEVKTFVFDADGMHAQSP